MKKRAYLLGLFASLLTMFATVVSASACWWYAYQAKEPECLREE